MPKQIQVKQPLFVSFAPVDPSIVATTRSPFPKSKIRAPFLFDGGGLRCQEVFVVLFKCHFAQRRHFYVFHLSTDMKLGCKPGYAIDDAWNFLLHNLVFFSHLLPVRLTGQVKRQRVG